MENKQIIKKNHRFILCPHDGCRQKSRKLLSDHGYQVRECKDGHKFGWDTYNQGSYSSAGDRLHGMTTPNHGDPAMSLSQIVYSV